MARQYLLLAAALSTEAYAAPSLTIRANDTITGTNITTFDAQIEIFNGMCYQEQANVSTDCGGNSNGSYLSSSPAQNYANYTKIGRAHV